MLDAEDYYLFPIIVDAVWAQCRHCKMHDDRVGIGGRLVQCHYCLNTRTSLNGADLPKWVLDLISDQDHYAYDTGDDWMNATVAKAESPIGQIELFVWIRQHRVGRIAYFLKQNFFFSDFSDEIKRGKYPIYDSTGKVVAHWDNGNLTYEECASRLIKDDTCSSSVALPVRM
jgi:hypothetical protein